MIQQQNYRDQSIWFAKITEQEGVAIYLRNVHVTMPYALTQIANWSQGFFSVSSVHTKKGDYTSSTKPHLHLMDQKDYDITEVLERRPQTHWQDLQSIT